MTSKAKKAPTIKYPIFAACRDIEEIPFWRDVFEKCAYGTFRQGLLFKDSVLSFKKGKKKPTVSCYVPEDPKDALIVVKIFFRKEMDVISVDEVTKKKIEMNIAIRENKVSTDLKWKDIRAPTTRQQMISSYVHHISKAGELTRGETNNLHTTINVGINCGTIWPDDIVIREGKIVDILGVDRDANGFFTTRYPPPVKVFVPRVVEKQKQERSGTQWAKIQAQYKTFIGSPVLVAE